MAVEFRQSFGFPAPAITVTAASTDTWDLCEAFAAFLQALGRSYTLTQQGGAFVLAGEEVVDYQEAFGVLEEAGLMASPPSVADAPEDLGSLEDLGFTQDDIDYAVDRLSPPSPFAVGDLVELKPGEGHFFLGEGERVHVVAIEDEGIRWNHPRYPQGVWGYAYRFRKVTEEAQEPTVPLDIRTGLAIPAPGFPWTDTKGLVTLKEPEKPTNPFQVGDLVRNPRHDYTHTVVALGCPFQEGREHDAVTYANGEWDRSKSMELVSRPATKTPTEFKQGDIVKVVRVIHSDDRKVLDRVGSVQGVSASPCYVGGGQTVQASFWVDDDDLSWWVHPSSLELVYRPGNAS